MTAQDIGTKILPTLKRQGVIKAAIFGSAVRGDATSKSDVDILVDFKDKKTLLDIVRLQNSLEKILSKKVDLLTYKSINPLVRKSILQNIHVIL